ncbi:MAG: UbiD family decarboxylase [Thermodesulfobacteriota bacterium]
MVFHDLREYAEELEKLGELRVLPGVHWDLEIGRITTILCQKEDQPVVLFDQIADYPKGYRVLVNPIGSKRTLALCLGIPYMESYIDILNAWRKKLKTLKPIPPKVVTDGPVLENVQEGKDVNLWKFPVPKWNTLDGGRFIGTGSVTILRDPDEGWVNLGTYRVMVHDESKAGFFIAPGRHGSIIREKYFAQGQKCKVSISCGQDPQIFMVSSMEIPYRMPEYDFTGGLKGEPIEVIESDYSGLPIPARAEIVIEGEASMEETLEEGPFGEWPGYYGSGARQDLVIRVKRILHRNDPILLGVPPGKPPWSTNRVTNFNRSAMLWDEMEGAGVPDIKGVWCHPSAAGRMFIVVAIKQRYPGHARQAGLLASSCQAGGNVGRYTLVVDEDIDPTNTDDILWALSSRSDPADDIEIIRRCWSTPLDPLVRKGAPSLNTRAIIDATRPYEWMDEFPPVVGFPPEELAETLNKWGKHLAGHGQKKG